MAFRPSSRYVFILLAIAVFVSYAYFETRGYIHGPQLTITAPTDGFSVTEEELTVEGDAKNITAITLNGRAIFVDEAGHFKENVVLMPGYNALTLAVTDRYERTNVQYLRGMYMASAADKNISKTPVATSTNSLHEASTKNTDENQETATTSTPLENASSTATHTPATTL
ncbi:hypothetical protein IPJ70_01965 [Candidatus Campbellbacteria bacterium]|nr:MAG: hypothetical protein IPJ70_01965 [Candidatus Campbellbacteria bacterium]